MRVSKILNALNAILLGSVILWILGWLFIGAYYCNPNAEDLSLSETSRDLGIVQAISNTMITYDGRYFTNLLHGINPLTFNWVAGYKWMPILAILFFCSSLYFLLTTILVSPPKPQLFIFSLLFTVFHFATAPSLPHDLYWMVSCFVYLYPWALTFLWLGCYLRYNQILEPKISFLWFLAASMFLISCIGMNEMFLVTNFILLSLILHSALKKGKSDILKIFPFAIIGFGCILFFITSPGIIERSAHSRLSESEVISLEKFWQSFSDYKSTTTNLLKNGLLLCIGILVLLNAKPIQIHPSSLGTFLTKRRIFFVILFFFIISFLMTLAYYLPIQLEIGYPARIFNSSVVLQQFIFFALIPLLATKYNWIQRLTSSAIIRQGASFIVLATTMLLLITTKNNISKMQIEFNSGQFGAYDQSMQSRYVAINKAKASSSCWQRVFADSLHNPPTTIYHAPDLCSNRNPESWNLDYEIYFRVDEISLTGDTASKL